MDEFFTVLALDGELVDYLERPDLPFLTFTRLSWEEAVQLCRLSFRQGFRCVVWQTGTIETGGTEYAEKKSGEELHGTPLALSQG